jgi:hypothetical protein
MENIYMKAEKYAEGKAYEAITNAIAQAYADGFKDGYKTRDEEVPVDLRDNKREFIDLGLPSGTLWATDYEKVDDKVEYKPYPSTGNYKLPTEEQWNELKECCKWEFNFKNIGRGPGYSCKFVIEKAFCIGPNGNILTFDSTGYVHVSSLVDRYEIFFWLNVVDENKGKHSVNIYTDSNATYDTHFRCQELFSGYKLPIRLVR